MLNKYLDKNFYYNKDGSRDEIVGALGNCFIQCSYIMMKTLFPGNIDFSKVYLNETTIMMLLSNNDIFDDIRVPYTTFTKNIFKINEINDRDESFETVITRTLNSGKIPLISTIIEKLSFSRFYIPSCDLTKKRTDHFFLVVDEDEENYYIVESPDNVNKCNVRYYNETECVILPKDELREAAKQFCSVLQLEFDKEKILYHEKNSVNVLKDIVSNFEHERIVEEDSYCFLGEEALLKFREFISSGKMKLNGVAPSKDRELYDYFDWKIWTIKGSRDLMTIYFKGIAEKQNYRGVDKILDILKKDSEQWTILKSMFLKSYFKGKYDVDDKYIQYLDPVIQSEKDLVLSLKNYIDEIEAV